MTLIRKTDGPNRNVTGLGHTLCNVIVLGNDAMMRKAAGVGVIPVKCDGSKMSRMC